MEVSTLIYTLTIIAVVTPILRWWLQWRRFVAIIDKIPGPRKVPFLGTFHIFIGIKRTDIFDIAHVKRHRDYPGGISRTWMSYIPEVRLAKPEYVEKVLSSSKNITKSVGYEFEFKKWLGNGLVTSTGEQWHTHRKIITPTFHFSILEGFVDVFTSKCEILVEKLQKFTNTHEAVDILPFINLAALDIICGKLLISYSKLLPSELIDWKLLR